MEDEDGYVILDRRGKRGTAGNSPPRQGAASGSGFQGSRRVPATGSGLQGSRRVPATGSGLQGSRRVSAAASGLQGSRRVPAASPRCPRRLLGVLTAALALSFVLCLSWWVAQRWQPEGTAGYGNASLGIACSGWNGILRELRRILCPPREIEGCRLCPVGWMLLRTKCYWVSDGMNPWNKSREDCGNRGSALLVPWDQDELEFLNESLQKPTRHFWIGLSVPVAGTDWMWENGSDLDQDRFQMDLGKLPGACGTLRGNGIDPQDCDTRLQWICQRESAEI